jgi:hypothetical protein
MPERPEQRDDDIVGEAAGIPHKPDNGKIL